ncbi:MAG TPA: hypothetical protein VM597_07280 [Gemmataceae bacterium]|nr:hypothetical protein [Gemmataceae bacterium]
MSELSLQQRGYLLHQIAQADGQRLAQGKANAAIPTAARKSLGLDTAAANRVRAELQAEGLLGSERVNRVLYYILTDEGRAYLERHRAVLPQIPGGRAGRVIPPTNEQVRLSRVAYLLLQLFKAPDYTLHAAEANKRTSQSEKLELNAATAQHVRRELAAEGLLTITATDRSERYTLTPAGRLRLGTLSFYDSFRFDLRGKVLNDLLEAAREAAKQFSPAEATPGRPAPPPAPDEVERTIINAFQELLRERHSASGMVPVHEARAEVRRRLGDPAARHDAFDPAVLRLRQAGKFRLVPITDLSRASADQLQASIPGLGETLFFLEAAREPVAR